MATTKQIRTARILSENPRKSVSAAMREAGYSDRSAEKPQELTKSKGWQELMQEALPDEKLLEVHRGLLEHPDWHAREAGLDKAYKLKSKYAAEKVKIQRDRIDDMSDEELDQLLEENKPLLVRYRQFRKKKQPIPAEVKF